MQAALLAVVFGLVAVGTGHTHLWLDYAGVIALAIWGMVTSAQAVTVLKDIRK